MSENQLHSQNDRLGIIISLLTYLIIFSIKLISFFITGILILLAEALHTLTDILISVFLLVSSWYSNKAPDKEHPFGHTRAQYIAALVAATIFLTLTSYELYATAIPRLFNDNTSDVKNINIGIIVILISFVLNSLPLLFILRKEGRTPAITAQLKELINDQLGLAAAFVGIILISRNLSIADPIMTMVVATIIAINAIILFKDNFSYLLGRSLEQELIDKIRKIAISVDGVNDVHDINAVYTGPKTMQASLHIDVDPEITVVEAHKISLKIKDKIHESVEFEGMSCTIHVDPISLT